MKLDAVRDAQRIWCEPYLIYGEKQITVVQRSNAPISLDSYENK